MKKILVAISSDLIRNAYGDLFQSEGFTVIRTNNGKEALTITQKERTAVVLLDTNLAEVGGLAVLKKIRENDDIKRIPVIIFSQYDSEKERQGAMDLEANDFVSFSSTPPGEVLNRIRIIIGEQKSYRVEVDENSETIKKLMADMDYETIKCERCGGKKVLNLIKDLSNGKNRFIASFICQKGCE